MGGKLEIFRDFLTFIRVETALFISLTAVCGYLLFNNMNEIVIPLFLAVQFAGMAGYACNKLIDKKEDFFNQGRLDFFAANKHGYVVFLSFLLLGVYFSFYLPLFSFLIYTIGLFSSIIYSIFRLKKIPLFKNIYTAIDVVIAFLVGVTINEKFLFSSFTYFPLIFLMVFSGTLIGDLRGGKGDKLAGIKNFTDIIGENKTKNLIFLCMVVFIFWSLFIKEALLITLIPFAVGVMFFSKINDMFKARMSVIFSFITFGVFVILSKLVVI